MGTEDVLTRINRLIVESEARENESRCGYDRSRERGMQAGLRMAAVMVELKEAANERRAA